MNKLTQTLLTGSAFCALMAAAPAVAQPKHPAMHVTALYAGHAVNKTKVHGVHDCRWNCSTYTYGIYSSKSADARNSNLYGTYYKWNSAPNGYYTLCSHPKQHVQIAKKSVYAKIDSGTETYSFGCPSGRVVFYGDVWTNKTGVSGDVDKFQSSLIGHWKGPNGQKYIGTMDFDVEVTIQ
jgi:hypothetical protein